MFISLDLETTGVDPAKDKIIEFGAVKFDLNGEKERLQFLINPGITLPQIITHITGITDKDLENKPSFQEKEEEINAFISNLPIIGHNIKFDTDFLRGHGLNVTNPEYDTMQLASILLPDLPSYSLEILSHELSLKHEEKHRALDDAIAAMELFLKLTETFQNLPPKIIEKIQKLLTKTNWPLKDFLQTLKHRKSIIPQKEKPGKKIQEKIPKIKDYKEILDINKTSLYQLSPPYEELIKALTLEADKDSYISISHQLFRTIESSIPDTIAKIDSPNKYISIKRLEEFEKKQFFEDYEISALLKYIIWLNHTKTGLLSEVPLFHQEKSTIQNVNIDKNFTKPEEEKFFQKAMEKDLDSPAICTHDFIIERKPKIQDLILIDLENFTKTLFFNTTSYIKLEILLQQLQQLKEFEPENKTIETLTSKSTILFGLIGFLYEKFNDKNPYKPRTTVKEVELQSKEWSDVQKSISNLIEISKELGEINNEKTYPHLQNWKNSLKTLQEIFNSPEIENFMTWIEEDMLGNIIVRRAPYSIKPYIKEILENCQNYKILSENLDLNDSGKFIKNMIGLPAEISLKILDKKREDLQIFITNDPNLEAKDNTAAIQTLIQIIKEKKGKTAVIFNSKQQLNHATLKLGQTLKNSEISLVSQLTGSLGKITEKFKQNPENSILLLTPNFWGNFKNYKLIDTLIILKIPFDPPSDPFIITNSCNFSEPFSEFQIPMAVFSLRKIINRLAPSPKKQKEVMILDPRIITKNYGKAFLSSLEQIAPINTVNTANLYSIVKTNE